MKSKVVIVLSLLLTNVIASANAGTWICSDPQNSGKRMKVSINFKAIERVPVGKVVENASRITGKEMGSSRIRELSLPILQMNARCPDCFAYLIDPNRGKYGSLYFMIDENKETSVQVTDSAGFLNFSYGEKLACVKARIKRTR